MGEIKGYEAFKAARESSGYSFREFAAMADISLSMLVYYENGRKSLLMIPLRKAVRLFELLGISLHDFYMEHYSEELDVSEAVRKWKMENPREYSARKLFQRTQNRIFKLRERGRLTPDMHNELLSELQIMLGAVEKTGGAVTDDFYESHILELKYRIGKCLEETLPAGERIRNAAAERINDCILHSDYSYKDLALLTGISNRRLSAFKNAENGYDEINIKSAMKICNVFSKRFEDIFTDQHIKKCLAETSKT